MISYRQIRAGINKTQEDVAIECEVSKKTVARFEAGNSKNKHLQKWYDIALEKIRAEVEKEEQKQ